MEQAVEQRIRESWQEVGRSADLFAATFYEHLFGLDPGVRTLFHATDLAAHHAKFAGMLSSAIDAFDDPRQLVTALSVAGRRHVDYGVLDRHYDTVGQALFAALAAVLGDRFTPELRGAWREAYGLMAAVMRRGARSLAAQPAPAGERPSSNRTPDAATSRNSMAAKPRGDI